jgi:hypothetical protein
LTFEEPLITNKHPALSAEKITPPAFRVMNMEKAQIKKALLHFIIIITMSTLLGYLSHNLINGVINGFFVSIGFAIFDVLHKSN